MILKQKLLDFLVCPTCRKSINVKIKKKIGTEIIEGTILCHHCKDNFKITKGIPRFVVDKTKDFVKTETAFSAKWKKHHKNHHKKDWVDFQRKWFLDRYGWKTLENFNNFLTSKSMILDAGTGIGNSAKFLSATTLIIFTLIPTLVYFFSVYQLGFPSGNVDIGSIVGSYIGLIFLGAVFASIGVFASSLSDNQVISFIIAIMLSAFLYLGFEFIYSLDLFGNFDLFIRSLGISSHYSSISRGVIDTRDLIYFISVIVLFLYLTNFSLARRKW